MSTVRPTIRVRLTAYYSTLFAGCALLLMAAAYWLMSRHLTRTLPEDQADRVLAELASQFALILLGATLVSIALGWAMAGRVLAPLSRMTATARLISEERLDRRIALDGPRDELRELADTLDAMLDRLGEAFEAQRRFVANASHELRSPLTVIRTEADVALADPGAGPVELRAMGEAVLEATEQTDALLESLLLLARSQRGLERSERVDLAAAAAAAAHAIEAEARERGIALRVEPGDAPAVTGDRHLLERLIGNLLENGVRHNDPGGFVALAGAAEGASSVLRVESSGPAVPPAVVARLTEPFERGGRHADRRGAGLGLSIVRSVAEAHGGGVRLEARPAGGLVVVVTLPAAVSAGGAAARGSVPSRSEPALGPGR
jgi:signal transduction histidine kinase